MTSQVRSFLKNLQFPPWAFELLPLGEASHHAVRTFNQYCGLGGINLSAWFHWHKSDPCLELGPLVKSPDDSRPLTFGSLAEIPNIMEQIQASPLCSVWIPDPQKLWDNKPLLFYATNMEVTICASSLVLCGYKPPQTGICKVHLTAQNNKKKHSWILLGLPFQLHSCIPQCSW
jgi:hypothetical protein